MKTIIRKINLRLGFDKSTFFDNQGCNSDLLQFFNSFNIRIKIL